MKAVAVALCDRLLLADVSVRGTALWLVAMLVPLTVALPPRTLASINAPAGGAPVRADRS